MGHIPEDDEFEEYMNASAEEWSKPEEPTPSQEKDEGQVNQWGAPSPADDAVGDKRNRWGSEPIDTSDSPKLSDIKFPGKKTGTKWWVIAIAILVVLCLCICLVLAGLGVAGVIQMPLLN